ncbi:MAG: hypothetical protein A3D92_06275 [Bacteroidetes bacterium RIFCSPHIGHO2_02_FULL_44_7]|nr:MAG: hypothetical protein A3D92_06275 [Bacteroidetes bacterium RIFCSPHIGHO2_02_FULL_44_7]
MVCLYHFTNSNYDAGTTLPEGDTLREIGKLGADGVYIFFIITGCVIPLSMVNGNYTLKRIHRLVAC